MDKVEKILVPLDGSGCAEKVLPQVEKLATDRGAIIALLRVAYARTFPGMDPTDAEVKAVREAEEYLQGVEEQFRAKGFKVETHIRYGHHAEEILDHASQEDVDLIAMATHQGGSVKRFLLGSVAEKVHRHSSKPVFLVPCA